MMILIDNRETKHRQTREIWEEEEEVEKEEKKKGE
jgi:hypothetical protein